ncbi:aminotransferase class I/II-fold pyridoxal phosphate-dependent enzyme [Pontibacter qinzhouensis]|uniref:O-succinylhomoserine sulfhydrylase n=1 Tax=Pontibacter qinzhouensis TaxID=2603253 RepID=A0A5C8J1E6_9BACT|nr:aminotransferase class I/II-fold pyridoxal phosphate-dependent enzyme [Pontibacter qinzhouensis]TXK27727.1 aminotransferase class I/II-fold pyridoxal phosphate-dependent enzyme [Pontibacter qinzhouensis]
MSKKETKAIRLQAKRSHNREHSVPLYLTSSFMFEDAEQARAIFADEEQGNIYSRYSNPNVDELLEKVCYLEKAEDGFAFSSGMAAIFSSLAALLKSGDHILAARAVFGSTHQLLTKVFSKWGITFSYADVSNPDEWESLITPATKIILVETPSNPGLEIIDLEWLGKLSKKHNLILAVDNCFATPMLQTPADYGTDLIIHSATKYMDGQGRVLGGLVVGRADLIAEIRFFSRHTGPAMSPFNAWVISRSLETLSLRMDKHCSNALQLAQTLEKHEAVEVVRYPFLPSFPQYELARKQMKQGGGIVTLTIKGGFDAAKRFLDNLDLISLSSNLGDTRTIATHPASTTHSKLTEEERQATGITPGLVRVSVGLEHVEDIIADITQALDKVLVG